MKTSESIIFLISIVTFMALLHTTVTLSVGYYKKTCPHGEDTVKIVVYNMVAANPGLGAGLIRLHFHDCFVRGCDGSVLLNSTIGSKSEMDSPANIGLRGFDVIDAAKEAVEGQCPGVMSCADILALAARDSAVLLGDITYDVPCGRLDGTVSLKKEPLKTIPNPMSTLDELEQQFTSLGLTVEDVVILSGAHSIGVSHCLSFGQRLYAFNATHLQDPSMDTHLADILKRMCPNSKTSLGPIVSLDFKTPNRLDNQYYDIIKRRRGLFRSDQALLDRDNNRNLINNFAVDQEAWKKQFATAMIKMGSITVPQNTSYPAQIRQICGRVN